MQQQFTSFLDVQSYAYSKAVKHSGNLGFEFIKMKNQGIVLSDSEKSWMKEVSRQAVRDMQNQIIERIIISGHRLADCRMARLFMSRTTI
jgi:hypothetical protein